MQYIIETIDDSNKTEMLHFLREHENFSLFLLGNFENYGATLTESPYSGNFKLIRVFEKVVGVFCLTRKGSLLIETSIKEPIFDIVLKACQRESMTIKGLIGNWDFCNLFWEFLKERKVIRKETFASREILYSVDLAKITFSVQPNVRHLTKNDYDQWKPLRLDYIKEEGFPNNLSEDQLLNMFLDKVRQKIIWGFFLDGKLVSIADFNAKAFDLGQVGSVYTIPSFRQKGYSKSVMRQLLLDAKNLHSLRKLIIFTGLNNLPAKNLYTALGAQHIGFFSLLFGN